VKREAQWAFLTAVIVLAAMGLGLVFVVQDSPESAEHPANEWRSGEPAPVVTALGDAGAEGAGVTEVEQLRARVAELEAERQTWETTLAATHRDLQAARDDLTRTRGALSKALEAAGEEESGLRVSFGSYADNPTLRDLDWGEMARATRSLTTLIADLSAGRAQWDGEMGKAFARGTNKLWGVGIEVNGQVPTSAEGNGEYTHPLVLSNLISESLEQAEAPLTPSQTEQVEALGREYDQTFATLQASYPEDAFALEKVLDELELKRDFSERLQALLTPEQSGALTPTAAQDVNTLDLYSPVLMLVSLAAPLPFAPEEELATKLGETARWWGLTEEDLPGIAALTETWAAALAPTLDDPVKPEDAKYFDLETALVAGRAQLDAMQQVVAMFPERDELTAGLRAARGFVVPRRVTAGE
jgi:hypothetical protein